MCSSLPLRPFLTGMALALVWLSLFSLVGEGLAVAQEPPPLPILYGGRMLIDGEPAPAGTGIVARVGDYETGTTVEVGEEGSYRNLLVQPPSSDYYDMPVTFHALGATALEQDVFKPSGGVVFKATGDAAFDLHFQLSKEAGPEETATATRPEETPTVDEVAEVRPTVGETEEGPEEAESEGGRGFLLRALAGMVAVGVAAAIGLWAFRRRSR